MELHKEIERLKTEKLILLRSNLENQDKIDQMRRRQEELEKECIHQVCKVYSLQFVTFHCHLRA